MRATHATAAVLSVGDELTLGQGLDTNSQWLSRRLVEAGILPVEHATVPDDLNAIAGAMRRLAGAADVLVCTGGLGPTADDLTRRALAAVLGEDLVEDAGAMQSLERWFKGQGRAMPPANRVQALRPPSAAMLRNDHGTAPGLAATVMVGGRPVEVFCLPGPPREMRPMFEGAVLPRLHPARQVLTRAVLAFGIGESEVAERLGDLMARTHMPVVGTTVHGGVVAVRIRHEGVRGDASGAEAVAAMVREVRTRLGAYIFGEGDDTLAGVVVRMLTERGETLATVESCTGGLLGGMVTEVAGSSRAYAGGWVTYSNEMKVREVGVPEAVLSAHGAVSRETAEAMARGGREQSGADWCLSITGIAGPEGGTAEKPVGTVWIGLAGPEGVGAKRFRFTGERANIRDWSARSALAMLRFRLAGETPPMLREWPEGA